MTMKERDEFLDRRRITYSKKPIEFGAAKPSTPRHVVSAFLLVSVILWLVASMH
jgi:hypothetical protein